MSEIEETRHEYDLTIMEARAIHEFAKRSMLAQQIALYAMWKRNGWRRMGAETFDKYVESHFDISKMTAYRWIDRVRESMIVYGWKLSDVSFGTTKLLDKPVDDLSHSVTSELKNQTTGVNFRIVSNRAAQALSDLKTTTAKLEAWRRYEGICPAMDSDNSLEKICIDVARVYEPKPTEPARQIEAKSETTQGSTLPKAPISVPTADSLPPATTTPDVQSEAVAPTLPQLPINVGHLPTAYVALNTPSGAEVAHYADYSEAPTVPDPLPTITINQDSVRVKGEEGAFCFFVRGFMANGQAVSIVLDMDCLPGELLETCYRKWDAARKKHGAADVRRKTFATWKESEE